MSDAPGETVDDETLRRSTQRLESGPGRYEILGMLGRGGMGRVLEALDHQFSRRVAVKELTALDSDARARFEREATITGNLEHPGIPPVYERGERADGTPFYVMRKVTGRTLAEQLAGRSSLEERLTLLPVLAQVAQTVAYAHSQGVVHRDLKPQNVVVGTHGEVAVIDWGIAKLQGVASASARVDTGGGAALDPLGSAAPAATLVGAVMGTPAYMAPEQALGHGDEIDARTDVFALGAMLYQLLSGHPPYPGASRDEVLRQAAAGEVPPLPSSAPRPLVALCAKAMAKVPGERLATAQAFADALASSTARALLDRRGQSFTGLIGTWVPAALVVMGVLLLVTVLNFLPLAQMRGFFSALAMLTSVVFFLLLFIDAREEGRLHLTPFLEVLPWATFFSAFAAACSSVGQAMTRRLDGEVTEAQFPQALLRAGEAALAVLIIASMLTWLQLLFVAMFQRARLEREAK